MSTKENKRNAPVIGDIYLMRFDGSGSEQNGWRPGVVFQNNTGNLHSPNIIALPLTSAIKKRTQPTHVFLSASDTGLHRDSIVLCENPEKMSKEKLGKFITRLPERYMREIAVANLMATSAIAFLSKEELLNARERTIRLNIVS